MKENEEARLRRQESLAKSQPWLRAWPKDVFFLNTLWLFNIAMENGPFIDDFPIKTSIYKGFSMAMLNNQMVYFSFKGMTWAFLSDACWCQD